MSTIQNVSKYRPDIDGLRAVAVLSVIVYHALPGLIPGGFVGVDVFFVISGYLISGIILRELKKETFSFSHFYVRRIRRIFPALIVVLIFALVCGWLILMPADFRQLGKHVLAGTTFVSNLALYSESGYFDTSAELKPLLHLWSLGIEEQYYLVWPLMLFVFRRHVNQIFWMIAGVAVASMLLSIWATPKYPDASFFLPATRFWELMLGSIIAFHQVHFSSTRGIDSSILRNRWRPNIESAVGTALLISGLVLINEERSFPGWWAILPTAGTALLISAGPKAWINRAVLSNSKIVYIGLISYPLYLWHWPLLVYARILNGDSEPTLVIRASMLILAIVLAALTYEFVEKNIRYAKNTRHASRVVPVLAVAMTLCALGGLFVMKDFVKARSASIPYLTAISNAFEDWTDYPGVGEFAGDTDSTVLMLGDSHMAQYMPRVEQLVRDRSTPVRTIKYRIRYGCAPITGVDRGGRGCSEFAEKSFNVALEKNIEVVVISASWFGLFTRDDLYRINDDEQKAFDFRTQDSGWVWDKFERELAKLVDAGKSVVILLNGPVGQAFNPRHMVTRKGTIIEVNLGSGVPREEIVEMLRPVDEQLRRIANNIGATVIDPADTLCTPIVCPAVQDDGAPIFKDKSHLRESYVRTNFLALDRYVVWE